MKLLFVSLALIAAPLSAATVATLNTGISLGNVALPGGATDPRYTTQETGTAAVVVENFGWGGTGIPGSWLPNTADSKWIWQTVSGGPTNVARTFRRSFDLTGYNVATASITGRWSTDNLGTDIVLNGVSTGGTCNGFGAWCNFSAATGFVAGINTLDFRITDVGAISGFRAEGLVDATMVPEPAAWAMLITGFGLTGAAMRRRRRGAIAA